VKAIYVIIEKVMSAIVIIPSRYQSTRFPGKPLALIRNKPMIQYVYERAKSASLISEVFVATDNRLIFDAVRGFGGKALMTSEDHLSGTDRIAEATRILFKKGYETDIIVNVQGDEPLISPDMINSVVGVLEDERADIGTLVRKIDNPDEIFDPNVVKAVFNAEGYAIYFSRAAVPYHREIFGSEAQKLRGPGPVDIGSAGFFMFKHIGIYAYRTGILNRFTELPPSRLEETEKLEQLRALENGLSIKVKETKYETIGVDTPADLERVEKCLNISL
jgi:3-deoxy-manno-octulosonate cytidylyltransferase (CMP-KDO synthetase)